ncbi:MAG: hypothetical protein ACKV2Q_25095 [Planctomycetaceae bacterium]
MAQSNQSLRALFQRHIEQDVARVSSLDAGHRVAITDRLRKSAKTGERVIRKLDQRKIRTLGVLMPRALLLLGLLSLIGCSGKAEPRRVAVRGSVIVGDKLVPDATVRFLPQLGNPGPVAWTSVSGGLYNFTKLDGPYPGKYKVSVNLELGSLSKIASDDPNAPHPPMQWEQEVTVPDRDSATQHFLWKSAEELKAETKP